ncbi:MAG: cyclic nucleotide-binding domain-containing protein [Phycisphaerae bacterium]|nr:cyclic nucleotide-binding domain-containing protein [Phycisphaerae bacterium]NIX28236.1 cyclic nucleotide-binding domain-containing protein [Phycisphaerae bacterium]
MRQALKAIPLFKDLADEDLDLIAARLRHISYAKGHTIFHQGDMGDTMYLVESGQVIVWDEAADRALAYLGPGSFVGEIALLLPERRTASLKVGLDADLYALKKDDFDQLLNQRPTIAVYMTRELSKRLLDTTKEKFKPQARRISSLWGADHKELIKTLSHHIEKKIAIIPLPGCSPPKGLSDLSDVLILNDLDISTENLAAQLGVQWEVYGHIVMLLPARVSALGRRALALANTVISIGQPPQWITDNIPREEIWETTNDPKQLSRIARRLTGHTVGLALSSGGGKGLAHLGVMKVLQEENIPIDFIAGTSAGAFFGILYAVGWDSERFDAFADEIQTFNRWINWDVNFIPRAGILKGAKARDIIARLVENKRFEDLDIPFYCVAADIMTGEEIVFDSGDLADAIRASLSIPGLANPWHINNRYLIDGAFVDPIPAKLLRQKGADIVIASSVIQPLAHRRNGNSRDKTEKMPHFLQIITNIQSLVEEQLVKSQEEEIDVLIHTKVQVDHALDFSQARSIIVAGEEAARTQLKAIKELLEKFHHR